MRANFFTSNSKDARAARLVGLTLSMVIAVAVIADACIFVFVRRYTTADRFIENKESKFLHAAKHQANDVVFIGSSFTRNQISTAQFEHHGLQVYNLGISGRLLGDFASMTEVAAAMRPKIIALDISVPELFTPIQTDFAHLKDVEAFVETHQPPRLVVSEAFQLLLSVHEVHQYREAIYQRVTGLLNQLDIQIGRVKASPPTAGAFTADERSRYETQLARQPDCDVFKTAAYQRMTLVSCTNGDGIQYGLVDATRPLRRQDPLRTLNDETVAFLNHVISIGSATSKVVVVLQPVRGEPLTFDLDALKARIHAPVIDLTNEVFEINEDWSDESHFNYFGRAKYSELLWTRMSGLF